MNTSFTPGTVASEEPDIFSSASMVVRVAQELVDVAQESIVAQHKLTQTLLKRQEMVTEHIEQIERLMSRDNHATYEAEHEQVMAEYRFLDALTADVMRQNDAAVARFSAIQRLWETQQ
jgi:spore germination protein YaaH